jgi:FkbM family methyltransferase
MRFRSAGRIGRAWAAAMARPGMYRVNRLLYRLALRGMGVGNYETEWLSGEVPLLHRLLAGARPGDVVLDLGANEGRFSAALMALHPGLTVHAFEPHPETFARLAGRATRDGFVAHNLAVSDRIGDAVLHDYAGVSGSSHASLVPGVIDTIHGGRNEETAVAVTTLAAFCDERGIDRIFLLKLDIEGGELAALTPVAARLRDGALRLRYLLMEFNSMNALTRSFVRDFAAILPGHRVFRILPGGRLLDITDARIEDREIFGYQNLLFAQNDPGT